MGYECHSHVVTDFVEPQLRRFSNSVILRMTYGKSTPTANTDPEVVAMKLVVERFGIVMQPGAFLVDRIPILRYVPWYGRQLKAWFLEEHELVLGQMERVKNEIVIRVSIAMCVLCAHISFRQVVSLGRLSCAHFSSNMGISFRKLRCLFWAGRFLVPLLTM